MITLLAFKQFEVRTHKCLILFNEVANRVNFFPELLVSVQVSLVRSMLIAVHLIFFYGGGVSHLEVSSSGALDMHHHATRMILFLIVYERFPLIAKCVCIIAALNHHSLSRVTDLTCSARVL